MNYKCEFSQFEMEININKYEANPDNLKINRIYKKKSRMYKNIQKMCFLRRNIVIGMVKTVIVQSVRLWLAAIWYII